jgi:hypothetical protein
VQTEWTPRDWWPAVFERSGRPRPRDEDVWQFASFVV